MAITWAAVSRSFAVTRPMPHLRFARLNGRALSHYAGISGAVSQLRQGEPAPVPHGDLAAAALRLENSYKGLSSYVITPVLDRYGVPEREKPYLMAFYLHGLMAVISEWLKNDCAEPVEYIAGVIQHCVKRRAEEQ